MLCDKRDMGTAAERLIDLVRSLEVLREAWGEQRMTMDDIWRCAKVCRMANVRPYLESLE